MATAAKKTASPAAEKPVEKSEEKQEKSAIDFSALSDFEVVKVTVTEIPDVIKGWVESAYAKCKAEPQTYARAVLASEEAVNEAEKLARKYASSKNLKLRRQTKDVPGNVFMARITEKNQSTDDAADNKAADDTATE